MLYDFKKKFKLKYAATAEETSTRCAQPPKKYIEMERVYTADRSQYYDVQIEKDYPHSVESVQSYYADGKEPSLSDLLQQSLDNSKGKTNLGDVSFLQKLMQMDTPTREEFIAKTLQSAEETIKAAAEKAAAEKAAAENTDNGGAASE